MVGRFGNACEPGDSDWPRIEPNRVGIVNRLAQRREQAHQRNDTERRYAVAGVTPNFERVSQQVFPDELGNGVDDNNRRSLREAIGRAVGCVGSRDPCSSTPTQRAATQIPEAIGHQQC